MQPDTAGTAPAFRRDHSCGALAVARIRKRPSIYHLVERAAVRHGIPRLHLWQQAAKALTDRTLKIQNDLSERINPIGGPTLAEWLAGFRAAVDRYNEPHGGVARILEHIILHEVDFERWFRKTNKPRRGPQSGTTGYQVSDRKAFPEISRLRKEGRSVYGAALILARKDELRGGGTPESKAKRVAKLYRRERGIDR